MKETDYTTRYGYKVWICFDCLGRGFNVRGVY